MRLLLGFLATALALNGAAATPLRRADSHLELVGEWMSPKAWKSEDSGPVSTSDRGRHLGWYHGRHRGWHHWRHWRHHRHHWRHRHWHHRHRHHHRRYHRHHHYFW